MSAPSSTTNAPLEWGPVARESASHLTKGITGAALQVIQHKLEESSSATVSAISTLHQNHDKIVSVLNSRIALLEASITTALANHTSQVESCITSSIQEADSAEGDVAKIVREVVLSAISELQVRQPGDDSDDTSNLTLQEYVGSVCDQAQKQVKDLSLALEASTRTVTELEAELTFIKRSTVPIEHLTETSVRLTALESQLAMKAVEFERLKNELLEAHSAPLATLTKTIHSSASNVATTVAEQQSSDDEDFSMMFVHAGLVEESAKSCISLCTATEYSENLISDNMSLTAQVKALKAETVTLKKKAANATEQLEASIRDYEVKERQVSVLSNQLCEAVYQLELQGSGSRNYTTVSPPPAATTNTLTDRTSIYRPLRKSTFTPSMGMKTTREGGCPEAAQQIDMTSIEKVVEANVKLVEELQANKVVMEQMLAAVTNASTSNPCAKRHRHEGGATSSSSAEGCTMAIRSHLWDTIRTVSCKEELMDADEVSEVGAAENDAVSSVGGRNGSQSSAANTQVDADNSSQDPLPPLPETLMSDEDAEATLESHALERAFAALGTKVDAMITLSLKATQAWMESLGPAPTGTSTSSNGMALEGLRTALGKYAHLCSEQEATITSFGQEINGLRGYVKDLEAKLTVMPTTEQLIGALQDAAHAMKLAVAHANEGAISGTGTNAAPTVDKNGVTEDSIAMQLNSHLTTISARENSLVQLLELTAQQSAAIRTEVQNKGPNDLEGSAVVVALRKSLEEERARADRFLGLYEQYAQEGISWMDQLWTMESRAASVLRELDETKTNYVSMEQHTEALIEMNTLIHTEKTLRDTIVTLEGQLKSKSDDYTSTYNKYYQLQSQMTQNDAAHRHFQNNLEEKSRSQQDMIEQLSTQLSKEQQDNAELRQQCAHSRHQVEQLLVETEEHRVKLLHLQERSIIELAKEGLLGEVFPDVSTSFLQSMEEGLFDVVAYRLKITDLENRLAFTTMTLEETQRLYASESCSRQQVTVDLLSANQKLSHIEADMGAKIDSLIIELATANRSILLLTRERDESIVREESRKMQVSLLSTDPVSENVRKYGLKVSKDLQSQVEETMQLYSTACEVKAELETKLVTAENFVISSKQRVEELESSIRTLEQNLVEAELREAGLKSEVSTAADKIAKLTKVAEEIDIIKKYLKNSEEDLERANVTTQTLRSSYQKLLDQSTRLTAALATRKPAEIGTDHQQIQKLKDEIESLRNQLQSSNRFPHRKTQQK